jgi:hypothetical protein
MEDALESSLLVGESDFVAEDLRFQDAGRGREARYVFEAICHAFTVMC